jgi:hypothetical protein
MLLNKLIRGAVFWKIEGKQCEELTLNSAKTCLLALGRDWPVAVP